MQEKKGYPVIPNCIQIPQMVQWLSALYTFLGVYLPSTVLKVAEPGPIDFHHYCSTDLAMWDQK